MHVHCPLCTASKTRLGRANPIVRMLEEAGIPYDFEVAVPGPHAGKFAAFGGKGVKNFAPPYLKDGDVVLSQSSAIFAFVTYLLGSSYFCIWVHLGAFGCIWVYLGALGALGAFGCI